MPGPLRINVDNLGSSTFVGQNDTNLDPQSHPQRDKRVYQRSVKVHGDGLAFAGQRFSRSLRHDSNLEANSGTSSAVTRRIRGHIPRAYPSLLGWIARFDL